MRLGGHVGEVDIACGELWIVTNDAHPFQTRSQTDLLPQDSAAGCCRPIHPDIRLREVAQEGWPVVLARAMLIRFKLKCKRLQWQQ
jgi:hypothetical protein